MYGQDLDYPSMDFIFFAILKQGCKSISHKPATIYAHQAVKCGKWKATKMFIPWYAHETIYRKRWASAEGASLINILFTQIFGIKLCLFVKFSKVNFTVFDLANDLKFTLANGKFHSPWRVASVICNRLERTYIGYTVYYWIYHSIIYYVKSPIFGVYPKYKASRRIRTKLFLL